MLSSVYVTLSTSMSTNKQKKLTSGFTIVELLIVIVVIGILAAITIVSYNGVQKRAAEVSIKSDLKNASGQLGKDAIINATGRYPSSLSAANEGAGLKSSPGNSFQYTYIDALNTYCLTATSVRSNTSYHIYPSGAPSANACAGHSSSSTVTALAAPTWTTTQVGNLLTTPVAATIAGKPFSVSTALSTGTATGTHIDGNAYFGATVDGVALATVPTPDMQLTTGLTMTVRADITPGTLETLNMILTDLEYMTVTIYALDSSNVRLPTSDWIVLSQEYDGTSPSSSPNPYTNNGTSIRISPIANINDDAVRVVLDSGTLRDSTRIVMEFTSGATGDWVQWGFLGRSN